MNKIITSFKKLSKYYKNIQKQIIKKIKENENKISKNENEINTKIKEINNYVKNYNSKGSSKDVNDVSEYSTKFTELNELNNLKNEKENKNNQIKLENSNLNSFYKKITSIKNIEISNDINNLIEQFKDKFNDLNNQNDYKYILNIAKKLSNNIEITKNQSYMGRPWNNYPQINKSNYLNQIFEFIKQKLVKDLFDA